MNGQKHFKNKRIAQKDFSVHPKSFVFYDKRTGTPCFEVKADADGCMPVDTASSLLVVHCLVRRQMPDDFGVMVSVGENLLNGLRHRAGRLIYACMEIQTSVRLTHRQQEVLRGVQQLLSNKEIGMKLNLSERTVKFHVSSLLAKFEVVRRTGLIRKTADLLSIVKIPAGPNAPRVAPAEQHGIRQEPRNSRAALVQVNALERRSRR